MMEVVIDASVILKWYLPDETFGERAMQILVRHVEGDIALCAPTLLPYEILNALIVAERMGRVDQDLTERSFHALLELEIQFLDPFSDFAGILNLARAFNRSVYDASYLYLAKTRGADFVTGDRRLYNAVKEKLRWVKWIGEIGGG